MEHKNTVPPRTAVYIILPSPENTSTLYSTIENSERLHLCINENENLRIISYLIFFNQVPPVLVQLSIVNFAREEVKVPDVSYVSEINKWKFPESRIHKLVHFEVLAVFISVQESHVDQIAQVRCS